MLKVSTSWVRCKSSFGDMNRPTSIDVNRIAVLDTIMKMPITALSYPGGAVIVIIEREGAAVPSHKNCSSPNQIIAYVIP